MNANRPLRSGRYLRPTEARNISEHSRDTVFCISFPSIPG